MYSRYRPMYHVSQKGTHVWSAMERKAKDELQMIYVSITNELTQTARYDL